MYWEPWLESADSYQDFRESLKKRGIRNVPLPSTPMHMLSITNYVQKKPFNQVDPDLKESNLKKGMVRRKNPKRP